MNNKEIKDTLTEILNTCSLHLHRMTFAQAKVEKSIPLSMDSYYQLSEESIGFLDQYIFRFSKLQDLMGNRLFPKTLEFLAEPTSEMAFIDILNRLEKLHVIESAADWVQLRSIRNDVAHEYPSTIHERIEAINILITKKEILETIIKKCSSLLSHYGFNQ